MCSALALTVRPLRSKVHDGYFTIASWSEREAGFRIVMGLLMIGLTREPLTRQVVTQSRVKGPAEINTGNLRLHPWIHGKHLLPDLRGVDVAWVLIAIQRSKMNSQCGVLQVRVIGEAGCKKS